MSEVVRRAPDVLWRRSLDAVLLLPPGHLEPVTLAGTGPDVWDALKPEISLDDLEQRLALIYRGEHETMRADLEALVDRLIELRVAERGSTPVR